MIANKKSPVDDEKEILEVKLIGNGRSNSPGDFSEFLDSGQFADLVLRTADGQSIECHRMLLASRAVNFKYFASSTSFFVSEITFRGCVKIEHLRALISLVYQCQINGEQHQITSTLWKLIKIFGIRVLAKCYSKNLQNGHTALEHELRYDRRDHEFTDSFIQTKGAQKFERIVRDFRSEARRKSVRRENKVTEPNPNDPSVILISDDERKPTGSRSSSCSSVSSLSSSTSDLNGEGQKESLQQNQPQIRIKDYAKMQNGAFKNDGHTNGNSQTRHNENSAIRVRNRTSAANAIRLSGRKPVEVVHDWKSSESSGSSSEGEYRGSTESRRAKAPEKAFSSKTTKLNNMRSTLNAKPPISQCLQYNQNEMSIIVKPLKDSEPSDQLKPRLKIPISHLSVTQNNGETPNARNLNEAESENIICSPQLMFNIKTEPLDEDQDEIEIEPEIDHEIKLEIVEEEDVDDEGNRQHHFAIAQKRLPPPQLIPLPTKKRKIETITIQNDQMEKLFQTTDENGQSEEGDQKLKQLLSELMKSDGNPGQLPSFVLRNPRGNQQRTYTTDNLWAALMDVKSGESIYRASQQHKVPRKTLRNWMKRCHIKSAYPMPSQLREAAEKKKQEKYQYLG